MIKKILFILVIVCACSVYSQSRISGSYLVGDKKATIGADEMSYWLMYENEEAQRIQYEENTPENDQIWRVYLHGNQVGTIVFKSSYSSGIYTDYQTLVESYVKKIE
jgi:hypothetical protein